jgi:hypothetical protein
MRELPFASVVVAAFLGFAGCSGSTDGLPSSDGYGPLSNGPSGSGSPTSTPTSTPAPTSPAPTSTTPAPTPWADAGAPPWDAGSQPAWDSGGWASEAGDDDAGIWRDAVAPTPDASVPSTLLSLCVGEINELRNQNGAFPYIESSQLEAYAAQAAASDAQSGQAHGYFNQTNGGGVAFTEDEFAGEQVDPGGTAQQVLNQGLLDDEENQGGGFDNLVTNQLSQVGCGFAQDTSGNWWVTIEFQ